MEFLKRTLPAVITLIVAAAAVFYVTNQQGEKEDKRQAYEAYLLEVSADIPELANEEKGEKRPDQPQMAGIRDYYLTMDPATRQVPVERLAEARKQTDAARMRTLEPMPEWEAAPSNAGGRVRTIMWDPNDENQTKVWAGSVTGGLWYNDDITYDESEWVPVESMWSSLSISIITHDPNDPKVFYVGTGEAETARTIYRESSGVGVGIFKSMDGGESWTLLPASEVFKYVTDIAVRDEDGQSVVYASVSSGFYQGQIQQSNTNGLWRSEDGGESWEQVLPLIPEEDIPYAVSDIEIGADNKLYVGSAATVDHKGGAVIFTSTEGTSGSWTINDDYQQLILSNNTYKYPERVVLAAAPNDENRIYAAISVGYDDSDGFIKYQGNYLLRSDDKGESWTELPLPPASGRNWAYLSWHAMILKVHPEDADMLYAGGLDLFISANGGYSWSQISDWVDMYYGGGPQYVHGDQHDIAFNPNNFDEALFASDGGVFMTIEASELSPEFTEVNQGFNTLQFYTCALHPENNVFLGGLQDNGTFRYNGVAMNINSITTGGDGAYCFIDQNEPDNWITTVYYSTIAGWEGINNMSYNQWSRGTFVNPMAYDSKNNALFGNVCRFNGELADQIFRINGLPRDQGYTNLFLNTGTSVPFSHIALSPNSADNKIRLFAGTQSGRLFRIDDAHTTDFTVTEMTAEEWPVANISCVAIGSTDDHMLLAFSNYGVSSLWQTTDGGESWREVESNLPDIPVRWAIYHPEGESQAMIATETGVWICKNLDEEEPVWQPGGINYPNVRTDMLQMRPYDNMVLAATHGRGLMYTNWEFDNTVGIGSGSIDEVAVYPNPASDLIRIETREKAVVQIIDLSGKVVLNENIAPEEEIDIAHLPAGAYILNLTYENGAKRQSKFVKQ